MDSAQERKVLGHSMACVSPGLCCLQAALENVNRRGWFLAQAPGLVQATGILLELRPYTSSRIPIPPNTSSVSLSFFVVGFHFLVRSLA